MSTERLDAFDALLRERYSCRAFLPAPLPRTLIERIAAVAQHTPSWCNAQPWQLHLAGAAATERLRRELLAHVQQHKP